MMDFFTIIQNSLQRYHDEDRLVEVVRQALKEGHSKETIMAVLRKLHSELSAEGNENDDNIVLDVMDYLEGWCSPHMRL